MKRLLILATAVLVALMMNIAMTACGGSDGGGGDAAGQQGGEEAAVEEVIDGTKTLAYFNKYVGGGAYTMEMKTEIEGKTTTMKSAVKGDMLYSESEIDGTTSIMIVRDESQYIMDPASKTCMKMSLDMASVTEMFSDEAENYEAAVNTGTEEINGASYDYEEFEVEGTTVKYYFDGNNLKYIATTMEGQNYMMEIVSMEKGADASLFEIPSDYTVMEL